MQLLLFSEISKTSVLLILQETIWTMDKKEEKSFGNRNFNDTENVGRFQLTES